SRAGARMAAECRVGDLADQVVLAQERVVEEDFEVGAGIQLHAGEVAGEQEIFPLGGGVLPEYAFERSGERSGVGGARGGSDETRVGGKVEPAGGRLGEGGTEGHPLLLLGAGQEKPACARLIQAVERADAVEAAV